MAQPGSSWRPQGEPATQPHEYVRGDTCKILTLFHPASGQVHLKPVSSSTNLLLHGWLKRRLKVVPTTLPPPAALADATAIRAAWAAWQSGSDVRFSMPTELPPLRMLLVWDNLAGHKTPEMVVWLCENGVMPLYTSLGGSRLNMVESIQRILKCRTLGGQHPQNLAEIGIWFEQTAHAWNRHPTPFLWNGKRRQRWRKEHSDAYALGGSGAHAAQLLARQRHRSEQWHIPRQVIH